MAVTRKIFPFDDVIMQCWILTWLFPSFCGFELRVSPSWTGWHNLNWPTRSREILWHFTAVNIFVSFQKLIISGGYLEGSTHFDDIITPGTNPTILTDDFDPKKNTSLILFSGGTTGLPKGVQISSNNIIACLCSQWYVYVLNNPSRAECFRRKNINSLRPCDAYMRQ